MPFNDRGVTADFDMAVLFGSQGLGIRRLCDKGPDIVALVAHRGLPGKHIKLNHVPGVVHEAFQGHQAMPLDTGTVGGLSYAAPPFPYIQNDRAISGNEQGVDDEAQRLRVHHPRIGKVGERQTLRAGADVPCRHKQRVIVRGDAPQERIAKLQATLTEAVGRPVENILVGRQQVHGGIIRRGVPVAAVALPGLECLQAGLVPAVPPHAAGKETDQRGEPGNQGRVLRESALNRIAIAHRSGLNAFREEGTALHGAAQLTAIFRTELAVHVLRRVSECVDIHGFPPVCGHKNTGQSLLRLVHVRLSCYF